MQLVKHTGILHDWLDTVIGEAGPQELQLNSKTNENLLLTVSAQENICKLQPVQILRMLVVEKFDKLFPVEMISFADAKIVSNPTAAYLDNGRITDDMKIGHNMAFVVPHKSRASPLRPKSSI